MEAFFQRTLLFAILTLTANHITAKELYIGASAGAVKYDTGISSLTGTATLDEKDTGFKIFGGIKVNNNIAVELHYADFGEASLKGNNGDRFKEDGSTYQFSANNVSFVGEASSIGLSALIGVDSTSHFNPYLKLGLQRWKSEVTGSSPNGSRSVSDNSTDLFFGVGVSIG